MSTVTEITTEEDFLLQKSSLPPTTLLVLSFHTPWAAPCAQMSTILSTLASTYPAKQPPAISFISVDAEELPDISESYDVTAVPFLVLERRGEILETVSGSDAGRVREAVERHAGKLGNPGKAGLPPPLETTAQPQQTPPTTNGADDHTLIPSAHAPSPAEPQAAPDATSTTVSKEELFARLAELVKAAPVMLFMKGTPSAPQCGFSRSLVGMLRERRVNYGFFNILADEDVRQGLKEFADWPTFPQLWVGGELVGGLDIVKEELAADPDFFKDYVVTKTNPAETTTPAPATTTA